MKMKPSEAKEKVLAFFEAYLQRRSYTDTLACLTEKAQWIGTGEAELTVGRAGIERFLQEELAAMPDRCEFLCSKIEEQLLSEECAIVLLTARVLSKGAAIDFRVTATCVAEEDGCKIAAIHASTAENAQPQGAYFPVIGPEKHGKDFEKEIGMHTLDLIGKSIAGGVIGIYIEKDWPLYFINAQMLTYLGYTYQEFIDATGGKVLKSIHPKDRSRAEAAIKNAAAQEQPCEVQYRLKKKNGGYIWVSDTGKKGRAENNTEIWISVIRDISEELEHRRTLQVQAKKKAAQALKYDRLFESVLCGIVQYRAEGTKIIFENANREAIRIFGYETQAFWKKTDWDMGQLVIDEDRPGVLKELDSLREVGDKSFYEYRLCRKDGSPCWIIGSAELILDDQGKKAVQSVFLDIDDKKRAEQRNRLLTDQVEASNELLRLALEHTANCEFYYYPQERRCELPKKICEYYHTKPAYENMPYSFAQERMAPEYREEFICLYERIHAGERTASMEFHMSEIGIWCRETLSSISYTEDGRPLLVIGILEDITRQKEMELALEKARSKDNLTGLYNKEMGIRMAQKCLREKPADEACGLMLLDMDDFERINWEEGEAFADAILQEVASVLQAETGTGDVQIRLGGDEFMLFLRHCPKTRATVLGPHIVEQVKNILIRPDKEVPISVSIGMCVTEVVEEYNSLYRCAESTLKYVKAHGKGYAACYLDTSNELGISLTQLYTEEHPVNDINRKYRQDERSEEDLTSFALELLGKSKKLDDAVFLLLAHIGKSFQLDRVAIVEADREFLGLRFSYQWARRRGDFHADRKIYLNAEAFEAIEMVYDDEGLCEHALDSRIPAMPACLYAGIWNGGEFMGAMSFESKDKEYQFTKEQRRQLKELVKIVSSFLMKARADAVSRAKTDFLSRMSHEIRTPMNVISGMTTIAKNLLDDRKKTLDCLEKIESANTYLLQLINDILDMSRIESGKLELNLEPMDMDAALKDVETLLRPQAEQKGLALLINNQFAGHGPLIGDPLRLNQILLNIVGNAIKFTASGEIQVTIEVEEETPQALLRFSVRDTGVGIDATAMQRIFSAFEQADKSTAARHGGTGLGLSISSSLVQLMGGRLQVKSELGKGSEFYFTAAFPYAPTGALKQDALKTEKRHVRTDLKGKRLLLAEDSALNAEIACELLSMWGFRVDCAQDGAQALALYTGHEAGYYDGVLMDIRMPVMDGLEATRRIRTSGRADAREIPIIALTANAFDQDSKRSIESGMNGHLSKPIQTESLIEMLECCLLEK